MTDLTPDEKFKILGLLESLEPDHKFNLNNIIREETKRQLEDIKAHMQPSPTTITRLDTLDRAISEVKKSNDDFHKLDAQFHKQMLEFMSDFKKEVTAEFKSFKKDITTEINGFKEEFTKRQDSQDAILEPIKKTYDWVSLTNANLMKFLVFLSVVSGLIFGWFAFLKPIVKKIFG